MALDLHDKPAGVPAFTGGLSIDNLSWWFWVKAGIGLTLGIWVTMFFLAGPTAYFWVQYQLWLLKLMARY